MYSGKFFRRTHEVTVLVPSGGVKLINLRVAFIEDAYRRQRLGSVYIQLVSPSGFLSTTPPLLEGRQFPYFVAVTSFEVLQV